MTRHFSLAVVFLLQLYHCLSIHSSGGTAPLTSPPCKTERQLQPPSDDDYHRHRLRLLGEKLTGKSRIFTRGWGRQKQPCLKNQEGVDATQNATQIHLGNIVQEDSSFKLELENQINQGHGRGGHHLRGDTNYPGNQRSTSSIGGGVEEIGIKPGGYSPYLGFRFLSGGRASAN